MNHWHKRSALTHGSGMKTPEFPSKGCISKRRCNFLNLSHSFTLLCLFTTYSSSNHYCWLIIKYLIVLIFSETDKSHPDNIVAIWMSRCWNVVARSEKFWGDFKIAAYMCCVSRYTLEYPNVLFLRPCHPTLYWSFIVQHSRTMTSGTLLSIKCIT